MTSVMIEQLIQLGAVGLIAGYLLRQSNRILERMSCQQEKMTNVLIELVENNTRAFGELKEELEARPCIMDKDKAA